MTNLEESENELKIYTDFLNALTNIQCKNEKLFKNIKYVTIAGLAMQYMFGDDNCPNKYTNYPIKMFSDTCKKLFNPEVSRGLLGILRDTLLFLGASIFVVGTSPLWISDNIISGVVHLCRKESFRCDIEAVEEK